MKKLVLLVKRIAVSALTSLFIFWPVLSYAADTNETTSNSTSDTTLNQTGPQGVVGPTGLVGTDSNVGPNSNGTNQPAATSQVDSTNATTGSDSTNVNNTSTQSDVTANTDNQANINNQASLDLNSGQNNIDSNTGVGSVSTGDIQGSVNLINLGNTTLADGSTVSAQTLDGSNLTGLNLGSDSVQNATANSTQNINTLMGNNTTGPDSINLNTVDNKNVVAVISNNDATVNNTVDINANTGENNVSKNTQVGDFTTGNIDLAVNLINLENLIDPNTILGIDIFSILTGLNGDIVIPDLINLLTGTGSTNQNTVSTGNQSTLTLNNSGETNNNMTINTNSGENSIVANSSTGDITTGDTKINNKTTNLTNQDGLVFYIINVFGKWFGASLLPTGSNFVINQLSDGAVLSGNGQSELSSDSNLTGQADLSNGNTGFGSDNQNTVADQNQSNIDINNTATATNNININANTGKNKIQKNTLVGDIQTGTVNVLSNVVNVLNSLSKGLGKIRLGIINIFGDWKGNLTNKVKTADNGNTDNQTGNTTTGQDNGSSNQQNNVPSNPQNQVSASESVVDPQHNSVLASSTAVESTISANPIQPNVVLAATTQPESGTNLPYKLLLVIPGIVLGGWLIMELLIFKKKFLSR